MRSTVLMLLADSEALEETVCLLRCPFSATHPLESTSAPRRNREATATRSVNILVTGTAWEDCRYRAATDRSQVTRINRLSNDARRTPVTGIGTPEALTPQLADQRPRRITDEHRMVQASDDDQIVIIAARHHE